MSSCKTTLDLDPAIVTRARARREAQAIAELKRNGIEVASVTNSRHARHDFESGPDARAMSADDIRNVEPLTQSEMWEIMRRIQIAHPRLFAEIVNEADEEWGDWPDDDSRWALTPHAIRRQNERRRINERRRRAAAAAK